jgi:hypothetical protein
MQKLLCFILLILFLPFSTRMLYAVEAQEIFITSKGITMPIGRILLVQRGGFLCAIKFLHNEVNEKGEFSTYEYFEFEKGGWQKIREGSISLRNPSRFYKMLSYLGFHQPVYDRIEQLQLKTFTLFAHPSQEYHSTVYFWKSVDKPDPEVRLAPTPWRNIQEVNLSETRIKWYQYESDGKEIRTTIDGIWK